MGYIQQIPEQHVESKKQRAEALRSRDDILVWTCDVSY